MKKHRKDMDKESGKKVADDQNKKESNQKPHMKKPGEKGFVPHNDYVGDGSAGMGGTSGI
jgi:hypothetical protein